MPIPSLLRRAEHHALETLELSGSVVDLGGDQRSDYQTLIRGTHTITTVNMSKEARPDVLHDLEALLPLADASFDNALLINVLEHIFNYKQLIAETVRIVRPGGKIVIVVPFLFPVHPSPHDYRRFTAEALREECACAGLVVERLLVLGDGAFTASYLLVDRLMPHPVRWAGNYSARYVAQALDAFFVFIARVLRRKYDPADYALGICFVGRKP